MSLPITNLPIPDLDDRRFDDLMKEARSLILNYNKEWTNHNPSDPGITLLELFSWLSEMVIYRLNQVPVESHINFLKLIAGTQDKGEPEKKLGSTFIFDWYNFKPEDETRLRNFLKTELDIEWATNITYLFTWDEIPGNDNGRLIEFLIDNFGYLFSWDRIPGNDNGKLIEFLTQKFNIDWIKKAIIEKIDNGKTIKLTSGTNFLSLSLNDEKTKVNLIINDGRTDEFNAKTKNDELNIYNSGFDWVRTATIEKIEGDKTIGVAGETNFISLKLNDVKTEVNLKIDDGRTDEFITKMENGKLNIYNYTAKIIKYDPSYFFCWDDIPGTDSKTLTEFLKKRFYIDWVDAKYVFSWDEIPGNDNGRLIEFLTQKFGIDWVKTSTIEKIDDNKTIKVSFEKKYLLLKLNDEKTEVNLKIDDGRTDKFITKMENGILKIYKDKANIEKIDNTTIKLSSGNNFISLGLDTEKTKVSLITDDGRTDEYIVKDENGKLNIYNPSIKTLLIFSGKNRAEITVDEIEGKGYLKINGCSVRYLHAGEYLFCWDEVPGTDSLRLIEFLKRKFSISWAETAIIEKIEDGKIIRVSTEKNYLSLEVNPEKSKVNLKIDNDRTLEFIAKAEGGKLNIYNSGLKIYNVPDLDDAFKKLLTFLKDIDEGKKKSITEIKQAPVEFMESMYRAITSSDYEEKAKDCMKILLQKDPPGRAVCMTNRKLLFSKGINEYQVNEELPGHVSVIIIPRGVENSRYCEDEGKPTDRLLEEIKAYLDARRLITTRVHVVNPVYINVRLRVRLAILQNIKQNEVVSEAGRKINEYFNPISGGPEGTGWPLGRNIYRSEVYNLLESIPGIDHVAKIEINEDENISTLEVMKHQLIELDKLDIETVNYE